MWLPTTRSPLIHKRWGEGERKLEHQCLSHLRKRKFLSQESQKASQHISLAQTGLSLHWFIPESIIVREDKMIDQKGRTSSEGPEDRAWQQRYSQALKPTGIFSAGFWTCLGTMTPLCLPLSPFLNRNICPILVPPLCFGRGLTCWKVSQMDLFRMGNIQSLTQTWFKWPDLELFILIFRLDFGSI